MRFLKQHHNIKLAVLFLSLSLFGIVLHGGSSHAIEIGSKMFPDPGASSNWEMYMTLGTGDFTGDEDRAMILSDTPGTVDITIQEATFCNLDSYYTYYDKSNGTTSPGRALDLPLSGIGSVPWFSTFFLAAGINAATGAPDSAGMAVNATDFTRQCVNRNLVLNFNMDPYGDGRYYNPQLKKYVAVFSAKILSYNYAAYGANGPGVTGTAENSFRIDLSGSANAKAYISPSGFGGQTSSYFNLSNRNRPTNSIANYVIDVTPACDVVTDKGVDLQFVDADNGTYQSESGSPYPALQLAFKMGPRGTIATADQPVLANGVPTATPLSIDGGSGPTAFSRLYSTSVNGSHSYRVAIDGLTYKNAISYNIRVDPSLLSGAQNCGSTTCKVNSIREAYGQGSEIHPNDRVRFNVETTEASGLQIGVNGPAYPGQGDYGNYLVSGGMYKRAPVTNPDGVNDITNIASNDGGPYGEEFYAPNVPGDYVFNWGLVDSSGGRGWVARCDAVLHVTPVMVTIQGSLLDGEDVFAPRFGGITIETCTGNYPVTDGSGSFSFVIPQGTAFCIHPLSQPAHTSGQYVRPYAVGYRSCPGFYGNANPNYCTSEAGVYDNQLAGRATGNGYDRFGDGTYDYGYDIAFMIADTAACSSMTITNLPGQAYPNNQYRVSMTFVNTGGKTWYPGQWNAGYHSWQWPNQNTNNYLSNGKPAGDPNYDTRIPQTTPGAVGPGGTASFYQDITVPPWWTGANYPLEYRMVRDAGPASGTGGYWMWSPNSTTCATTIGVGQGTLFDTFQTTKKESGEVFFCNSAGSTHSGTSGGNLGIYSFVVPVGGSFCAGVGNMDAGAPGRTDVYPYAEGYNTYYAGYRNCAANAACIGITRYDYQVMSSASGGWDRASNTGYDLGVSSSPIITCTSLGFAGSYGVTDSYTGPAAVKSNAATIFTAPAVGGTISTSLSPVAGLSTNTSSATVAGLVPGGSANPAMSPVTFNIAGVYTFNGNFAWSGGGYGPTTAGCPGGTVKATESPYLRVYGGEVTAGASYATPCTTPVTSDINAFAKKSSAGYWIGAGSQYGAFSNGSINGFLTAALSSPSNPTILAFSNTTVNLATTPPVTGGNFGGLYCADEYWPQTLPTSTISTIDATKGALGGKYLLTGSTLSQTGAITKSMTIYVDGDVTITSDLTTGSSWASPAAIPSLYVIAKGNIYIKPNVHNLDGLYVAEPTALTPSVKNGRIWTCYNTTDVDTIGAANSGLWIASNCESSLKVNGALIAAKVNFLRTLGSVRLGGVVDNNPVPSCSGVTLYGDISFFGPTANLGMGSYGTMPAAIGSGLSSAYVPAGCEVILHDAAGLGGATKTLHGDWSVFSGADAWNDKTRSIEVKAISADLHQIGLVWSYNGLNAPLITHDDCVLFNVPTDVYWTGANANKYLCVSKDSAPGLEFRIDGVTPAGKTCVNINEADTNGWDTGKTLLCWTSSANLGLAWTWAGGNTGIPGMECTAVYDLNETHTSIGFAGWVDNYLCEPRKTTVIDLGVSGEPASSANIAEVIQFAPELLLSTPALSQTNTSNNLNSVIGLQPSL